MKRTVLAIATAIASLPLNGCGHEGENVPAPHLVPNALVDNLYVQVPFDGAINMSLDVAYLRLKGRCLEVVWNGRAFTPVFTLPVDDVSVTDEKVTLPYITLPFGQRISVQGPLVPSRIRTVIRKGCPQEALFLGGLAKLEDIPNPVTPPAVPH